MAVQDTFNNDNVLVDKMLGRSYDVVKKVYLNLDTLNQINENQNINTLVENYDEVKGVLDVADDIKNVSSNMDSINAAGTYAAQAKAAVLSAQDEVTNAKNAATEAQTYADDAADTVSVIEDNIEAINTVSENIDDVKAVAQNVDNMDSVIQALADSTAVSNANTVVTNLDSINSVADNINTLISVADNLISTGDLDSLAQTLEEIKTNLTSYQELLTQLQEVSSAMEDTAAAFDTKVTEGVNTIQEATTEQIELITQAKGDLDTYLEQSNQALTDTQEVFDKANTCLLKIKDLYHLCEETLNDITKKGIGKLMYEADRQILRLREEGDSEVDRVHNTLGSAVDEAAEEFTQQAEEIKNQKAEELGAQLDQKAEEVKAELDQKVEETTQALDDKVTECITTVQEKVDEVNFDISELTERVEKVEETNTTIQEEHKDIKAKLDELTEQVVTQSKGDVLIGYKDYSQSTNTGDMVVGTTYINALDSEGNYIQLSQDTMQPVDPEKEIAYLRYYIKSESGQVTYIDRKVEVDLTNYVQYDSEGNIVLPNNIFFQGKTSEGVDTDLIGIDTQDNIVVGDGKKVVNIKGTTVQVNGDTVVTETALEEARTEITQEITEAIGDIPQATTEVSGIIELATKEEAAAGTDTTKAVTPEGVKSAFDENLTAALGSSGDGSLVDSIVQLITGDENLINKILSILKDATTEQKGIVELATTEEVKEGTSTSLVVTASSLVQALPDILTEIFKPKEGGTTNTVVQQITNTIAGDTHLTEELAGSILEVLSTSGYATETSAGIIRIATVDEATAGTSDTTAITPAKLKNQLDPVKTTVNELSKDVEEATDTVANMQTSINNIQGSITNLQSQVSANSSNISSLTNRVSVLEQGGGGSSGGNANILVVTELPSTPEEYTTGALYILTDAEDNSVKGIYIKPTGSDTVSEIDFSSFGSANTQIVTELPEEPSAYEEDVTYILVDTSGNIEGIYIKPTGSETVNSIDYTQFLKVTDGFLSGDINFTGDITFSGSVGKDAADSYEDMADTDLLAKGDIKDIITEIQSDIESLQTGGVVSATETQQGIAEIATDEEVATGTDDERIVTPKKLKTVTNTINESIDTINTQLETINTSITNITSGASLPSASTTQKGMVELADADEIVAGTATDKVVTVKDVADMIAAQFASYDNHFVVDSVDDITTESADGVYLVTGA